MELLARRARVTGAAPLLLALAMLGGCTTAEMGADAGLNLTTATMAPRSKPLDEVKDELTLGKEHYRAENYGLAEMHFRRAVESARGDAEAWLGLAAAYDQLKRFELADRAYAEAFAITGPTAAFLNNRGYSYLLRGDYRRASRDLAEAAARDPENPRIRNNLQALDGRVRKRA